jgi:hypothetical protein
MTEHPASPNPQTVKGRPATESGRELLAQLPPTWWPVESGALTLLIRAAEAEAVTGALDATREHMACACPGIEGHLAERGLLFREEPLAVSGAALVEARAAARKEVLDPRDVLLEFGQWLATNLSARRGMEEALDDLDEDAADQYAATVDAFLDSLSTDTGEEEP